MGVRDQIHESDEYQALARQTGQNQQASQTRQRQTRTQAQGGGVTVAQVLGPVTDWEKSDVEFWTQVAQLVLLYLIWRELRRGS